MQALVYRSSEEGITLTDRPTPRPGDDEVLLQMKAAALNHRDVWITKGQYPGIRPDVILGSDGVGTVDGRPMLINPNVNWGDDPALPGASYTILGMPTDGTFAEEVVLPANRLLPMPSHLSLTEAAALPLGGLTAYRALFTRGGLRSREKVLISGIGGGVALLALQFAVQVKAEVYVTSSRDEKIARAVGLGAHGGANYRSDDWARELRRNTGGFDLIIDSAGGEGFNQMLQAAKPGARIITYGGTAGATPNFRIHPVFWNQLTIMGIKMGSDQDFADMVAFVAQHELKPVVDSVWPLERAEEAFERMAEGKQFGKIVLQIGDKQ